MTHLTISSAPRTGVVFYKLFYPTAQMITFLFPAEVPPLKWQHAGARPELMIVSGGMS